jgi:hypothetical protein
MQSCRVSISSWPTLLTLTWSHQLDGVKRQQLAACQNDNDNVFEQNQAHAARTGVQTHLSEQRGTLPYFHTSILRRMG